MEKEIEKQLQKLCLIPLRSENINQYYMKLSQKRCSISHNKAFLS